jgi:hypothetical protein
VAGLRVRLRRLDGDNGGLAPAARHVFDRWLAPGIVASIALWILGYLIAVDDLTFIATMLVLPLFTTACALGDPVLASGRVATRSSCRAERCATHSQQRC